MVFYVFVLFRHYLMKKPLRSSDLYNCFKKNHSIFIFPSKDNQFRVLFDFIFDLSAPADNAHKSELQVHQPKTVKILTKQHFYSNYQPLPELLNVFCNQLPSQQDVSCSVRLFEILRWPFFAIGLNTIAEHTAFRGRAFEIAA